MHLQCTLHWVKTLEERHHLWVIHARPLLKHECHLRLVLLKRKSSITLDILGLDTQNKPVMTQEKAQQSIILSKTAASTWNNNSQALKAPQVAAHTNQGPWQ